VISVGHSRGGAIAFLFVFALAIHGFQPGGLYTYGSPRVGDAEFANHWRSDGDQLRVPKTRVPQVIALPFVVAYSIVWLLWTLGLFPIIANIRRFARRSLSWSTLPGEERTYSPIRYHLMSEYVKNVAADVEHRTSVCLIFITIIRQAALKAASRKAVSAKALIEGFKSLGNFRDREPGSPDAIEQVCQCAGIMDSDIATWIDDYRTFLDTRSIKREEEFWKEIDAVREEVRARQ
jgi:hypothetical protein